MNLPMYGLSTPGAAVRSQVTIVQIRASEVMPGDVVNRRGPERTGWIEVDRIETLDDTTMVIHDRTQQGSFTATGYDLVWIQTLDVLATNSHLPPFD